MTPCVARRAKCTYHTRDPARRAFKIPSHMKEDVEHVPKLAKYKYRRRTRIFPEESGPPSTPAAAAAPLSKFVGAETDEPLAGFVLAFAGASTPRPPGDPAYGASSPPAGSGRLSKSQAKLRGAVAVAGGETAVKPGPEVTCLVTTQSEVDKESARVTEARESTLPIVSEALIHEAIEARRKPVRCALSTAPLPTGASLFPAPGAMDGACSAWRPSCSRLAATPPRLRLRRLLPPRRRPGPALAAAWSRCSSAGGLWWTPSPGSRTRTTWCWTSRASCTLRP